MSKEISFTYNINLEIFRNGMTWIWDGTQVNMEELKIFVYHHIEYGSLMFSCITGEHFQWTQLSLSHSTSHQQQRYRELSSLLWIFDPEFINVHSFVKCWWGFRRNLSDKCCRAEQWFLLIRATWDIQVNMQNRHHLVPIRWSKMVCVNNILLYFFCFFV